MSAITVNTFPSIHSFTSARSWFLALIILLHVGFFWALNSGLSKQIFDKIGTSIMVTVPVVKPQPPPKVVPIDGPIQPDPTRLIAPRPPIVDFAENDGPIATPLDDKPQVPPPTHVQTREVVVVEPDVDPRRGLSEPVYPAASIRANQTGTVMLSVQVLENGRVGEVRVEQSSGHSRLDEAALREARLWRFKPGTRDGIPVVMWKQVPITFRLQ